MGWRANLELRYTQENQRTVARHLHTGPLRILQSLYPEGDSVCHNVLVHPPGGLVGGDTLDIQVHAGAHTHGLVTTPGATRFYRSDGMAALQNTQLTVETGARLEWLPLEAICYSGCLAENRLRMTLEPGGELLGWDITALGLPGADLPFVQGHLNQHIELSGVWLDRAKVAASDMRLLNSPLGLDGQRCVASLFFVTGSPIERNRKQQALDCAREHIGNSPLARSAGVTSPNPQVMVVRVLAPVVEPAMQILRQVRDAWRSLLWCKSASSPRIWSM